MGLNDRILPYGVYNYINACVCVLQHIIVNLVSPMEGRTININTRNMNVFLMIVCSLPDLHNNIMNTVEPLYQDSFQLRTPL